MLKIAYIDHYDSFSFNLIDWLVRDDEDIDVEYYRFDVLEDCNLLLKKRIPLVISPGPNSPSDTKSSLKVTKSFLGQVPILGVCLGQQILGTVVGAKIIRSKAPRHGSVRKMHIKSHEGIFNECPPVFQGATYNSLVLDPDSLPDCIDVTARCQEGEVQGIELGGGLYKAYGVQFHPESFMSQFGKQMRDNWLKEVRAYYGRL